MGSSTNYLIWRQISLFNLAVRQFVKCLCTFKNLFEKSLYVTCTSLVYIAGGKWEHIPPGAGSFPPFAQHYFGTDYNDDDIFDFLEEFEQELIQCDGVICW